MIKALAAKRLGSDFVRASLAAGAFLARSGLGCCSVRSAENSYTSGSGGWSSDRGTGGSKIATKGLPRVCP